MPKVVALCVPITDCLVHAEHMPIPQKPSTVSEISWQFGGNSATAIATVGRQGVSAGIIGWVGDDDYGRAQRVDFSRHNVDTTHLIVRKDRESVFCICVSDENGERAFLLTPIDKFVEPDEIDMDYLLSADYLLIERNDAGTRMAAEAMIKKGGEVIYDASVYSEADEQMLPLTTVFITSEYYLATRYGDMNVHSACKDMIRRGPHTVIFTLGERGCAGVGPEGEFSLPAFPVKKVVDTTGCGDIFHGAFIVGMEMGLSTVECARWASATSSFKCHALGGRAAQPTREHVRKFLETGEMDLSYIPERLAYYKTLHTE